MSQRVTLRPTKHAFQDPYTAEDLSLHYAAGNIFRPPTLIKLNHKHTQEKIMQPELTAPRLTEPTPAELAWEVIWKTLKHAADLGEDTQSTAYLLDRCDIYVSRSTARKILTRARDLGYLTSYAYRRDTKWARADLDKSYNLMTTEH